MNRTTNSSEPQSDDRHASASVVGRPIFDWLVVLGLWLLPLALYVSLIGRWSFSGDEFYTLVDSSKPVAELLSYERKPLYYLICHTLLQWDLGWSKEFLLRLPAAVAASLVPALFYALLRHKRYKNVGLLSAVLVLVCPWLFAMSQYARFYSLAFMFASITVIAGLRAVHANRKRGWIVTMFISGFLAGISQIPAGLVLPAGLVGLGLASFRENPARANSAIRRYGPVIVIAMLVAALAGYFVLKDVFWFWLQSDGGKFGTYSVPQLLLALAAGAGIGCWGLGLFPLFRTPVGWSTAEVYLAATTLLSGLPLMVFIPFGGGVSANYLMFCLPSLFLLAAFHWREIDERLPSWGYRCSIGAAVVAFNIPFLASTYSNGNHHDYRRVAATIDAMELENPIIVASGHHLLNMYLQTAKSEYDLGTFDNGVLRHLVEDGIATAKATQCPLLLVARDSRHQLSDADQEWLFAQFALVASIEQPRYDYRRQRMTIYRYRPASQSSVYAQPSDMEAVAKQPKLADGEEQFGSLPTESGEAAVATP